MTSFLNQFEGDFMKHMRKNDVFYDPKYKRFLISAGPDELSQPTLSALTKRIITESFDGNGKNSTKVFEVLKIEPDNDTLSVVTDVPAQRDVKAVPSGINNLQNKSDLSSASIFAFVPAVSGVNILTNHSVNATRTSLTSGCENSTLPILAHNKSTTLYNNHKENKKLIGNNSKTLLEMKNDIPKKRQAPKKHSILDSLKQFLHNALSPRSKLKASKSEQTIVHHKRNILSTEFPDSNIHKKKRKEFIQHQKRNILSDSNPNVDNIMGSDGNILVDENLPMITLQRPLRFVKDSTASYLTKGKYKREASISAASVLSGVWSGLGTKPEFVEGLVKHDITGTFSNMSFSDLSRHLKNHLAHHQKHPNRAVKRFYRKSNIIGAIGGAQENLYGKNEPDHSKRKKVELQTFSTNQNDKTSSINQSEELPSVSKRDVIPDDVEDNGEQSESKQMELGSLGSYTMKPKKEKRSSLEPERETNSALPSASDGKVVLAFDEIKELLPAKKIKDEEKVIEIPDVNSAGNIELEHTTLVVPTQSVNTFITNSEAAGQAERDKQAQMKIRYDLDKELVDGMILNGNKKSDIEHGSLKATKIVYEKNDHFDKGKILSDQSEPRSALRSPHLLYAPQKLGKAQIALLRADEGQRKYEQMKEWVQHGKERDDTSSKTDAELQRASDQLAESDAELAKLNMPYTTGAESAYLASKLEEKSSDPFVSTPQDRAQKFKKLQTEILTEQENYNKLVQEQQRQYEERQRKEQEEEERLKQRNPITNLPLYPASSAPPKELFGRLPTENPKKIEAFPKMLHTNPYHHMSVPQVTRKPFSTVPTALNIEKIQSSSKFFSENLGKAHLLQDMIGGEVLHVNVSPTQNPIKIKTTKNINKGMASNVKLNNSYLLVDNYHVKTSMEIVKPTVTMAMTIPHHPTIKTSKSHLTQTKHSDKLVTKIPIIIKPTEPEREKNRTMISQHPERFIGLPYGNRSEEIVSNLLNPKAPYITIHPPPITTHMIEHTKYPPRKITTPLVPKNTNKIIKLPIRNFTEDITSISRSTPKPNLVTAGKIDLNNNVLLSNVSNEFTNITVGVQDFETKDDSKKLNETLSDTFPFPVDIAYQPRKVQVWNKSGQIEPRSDGNNLMKMRCSEKCVISILEYFW